MDLRLPWPLGRCFLLAVVVGAAVFFLGTQLFAPTTYTGELRLLVLKMDNPQPGLGVEIVDSRVSAITALARSQPFALELIRESGVDLSVSDVSGMISADRPTLAAVADIRVTGDDEAQVQALTAHLSTAMSVVVDRFRTGALTIVDQNARALSSTDAAYTGPLYLEVFPGPARASVGGTAPRTTLYTVVGAIFSGLLFASIALLLHNRLRITSREDLDELLGIDMVASIPRPRRGRDAELTRYVTALALALDAAGSSDGPVADAPARSLTVGLASVGTEALRSRLTLGLAAVFGGLLDRPVIVVDLDQRRPIRSRGWQRLPWSRIGLGFLAGRPRPGVLDVVLDGYPLDDAIGKLPRRRIPRWAAQLGRLSPLRIIGPGHPRDDAAAADEGIGALVAHLSREAIVLVHLPAIPGPVPVRSTLGELDVCAVMLLDGWTPLDDAGSLIDSIRAGATGAVGYVLVDN